MIVCIVLYPIIFVNKNHVLSLHTRPYIDSWVRVSDIVQQHIIVLISKKAQYSTQHAHSTAQHSILSRHKWRITTQTTNHDTNYKYTTNRMVPPPMVERPSCSVAKQVEIVRRSLVGPTTKAVGDLVIRQRIIQTVNNKLPNSSKENEASI